MHIIRYFGLTGLAFSLVACASAPNPPPTPIATGLAAPGITVIPEPTATIPETDMQPIPDIAQYGLDGKLILIQYHPDGNRLVELELKTGGFRTLFQAPENAWLAEASVSPNGGNILLTYAPPPPPNETQFGYTSLYFLPYDGISPPQEFLTRSDPQESFFFSTWAPDGQSIYFTHLYRMDPNSEVPAYQNDIKKATLDGEMQTIVPNALWPAVSTDGSKLSYLYVDPVTFSNDLYLAGPDGSGPAPVLEPGVNPPVDAHLFTVDGSQLIFSMVNLQPAPASSWFEELFGMGTVSAHSVPSDWYQAPLSGGIPQRLTNLNDVNLNGDLSPDGSQMAFISASGLYIMNIDGSNQIQLSNDILIGTVDWIP
jgi:Tol biopolymer transport system component